MIYPYDGIEDLSTGDESVNIHHIDALETPILPEKEPVVELPAPDPPLTDAPTHVFGYRPSTITETTPRHRVVLGEVPRPSNYLLPDFDQIPVRDQGNRSTCVAESLRTIREYLARSQGIHARLSMEWLYDTTKLRENDPGVSGLAPDLALEVLRDAGIPYETSLPDATTDNTESLTQLQTLQSEAKHFTITSFGLVTTPEEFQALVFSGKPILVGVSITPSVLAAMETQAATIPLPQPGETPIGGHAMVIYGYETDVTTPYFLVRNSWGMAWGNGGNGRIAASYPGLYNEAWSISI